MVVDGVGFAEIVPAKRSGIVRAQVPSADLMFRHRILEGQELHQREYTWKERRDETHRDRSRRGVVASLERLQSAEGSAKSRVKPELDKELSDEFVKQAATSNFAALPRPVLLLGGQVTRSGKTGGLGGTPVIVSSTAVLWSASGSALLLT